MSNLKVGFGRADITPPNGLFIQGYYEERRGTGVLDRLTASCIAFSDGEKTAVAISMDLIGINQERGDAMRKIIAERTGLPMEAVFFACTHTHTGPAVYDGLFRCDPDYNSIMFRSVADAVNEAIADLTPASVFAARGTVKDIAFIRRFRMKDGRTQTNPGFDDPNVDSPISTPDEMLQTVKILREGKDTVFIVNFQVHPDVIGGTLYSADFPGFVRRTIEGGMPGVKCVYFNGPQGDTNHINFMDPHHCTRDNFHSYEHSRHMGLTIAGEAMKLFVYAKPVDGDRVDYIQHDISVPSNRASADAIPLAQQYVTWHETGKSREIPYHGMEYTTVVAEAYRILSLKDGPDSFTLHLNAVRFGNIAFSGIPGEPFTDIGRGIKEGSPFAYTLVCCCANGCEAYFPMQSAFDEGGYEARSSSFCAGIGETLIDESLNALNRIS